jgi:hypothetical protein
MASNVAPHVTDEYSDLQTLAAQAIRLYGDQAPESTDASLMLLMVLFANQIVEDVRRHPYTTGAIDYYKSLTDRRAIPDMIMITGLAAKYAQQQQSQRAQGFTGQYYSVLNSVLWNRKSGNGAIELTVVDGGSNPSYDTGS